MGACFVFKQARGITDGFGMIRYGFGMIQLLLFALG